ncbi:MAG: Hachiman antiphage defense system protein HamA [Christensenellales bacterium]|jgi:hypothetical protein
MCAYKSEQFNAFNVVSIDEKTSFLHVNLSDDFSFYMNLFDYFFDETRLLKYAENKTSLTFSPCKKNYVTLFKFLGHYIDDYNQKLLPSDIETEMLRILSEEYELNDDGCGKLTVRLDKIGKIGEYIFCNLLSEYYGFDCIIPKVHLTTDYNMSVYGIDALFYSSEKDMILFGESKLSKSLANGVGLINKSLKTYENQIRDEFTLMLSNRFLKNNTGLFGHKYADKIELSLSVDDFISNAGIKHIAVPVFIAHGTDVKPEKIFKQLCSIKQSTILGLKTQYIVISLPIFDKSKMISAFTQAIAERRTFYEQAAASE